MQYLILRITCFYEASLSLKTEVWLCRESRDFWHELWMEQIWSTIEWASRRSKISSAYFCFSGIIIMILMKIKSVIHVAAQIHQLTDCRRQCNCKSRICIWYNSKAHCNLWIMCGISESLLQMFTSARDFMPVTHVDIYSNFENRLIQNLGSLKCTFTQNSQLLTPALRSMYVVKAICSSNLNKAWEAV